MAKLLNIKINTDTKSISEMGYDNFGNKKSPYGMGATSISSSGGTFSSGDTDIQRKSSALVGGTISNETVISIGNGLLKIDGVNKRIVVNDGGTDRILIGFDQGGF